MSDSIVYGRNAVLEAIKAGREFEKVYIQKGEPTGSLIQIKRLVEKKRIPWQEADKVRLAELSDGGNHQGIVAVVSPVRLYEVSEILDLAREKGDDPFLVVLESIQDPHNLGAILRTAEAVGVHGVILSKHNAVGLTDAVAKTAAGAIEYVPVAKVSSIAALVNELKKQNIWVVSADMDGQSVFKANLSGPLALVIGGEHEGITRLVKERSDMVVSLPMRGQVNSLNASVAAGVLMYEAARMRGM